MSSEFDFQSYIAQHKPADATRTTLQNYAYIEDMKRLRQLAEVPLLSQVMEKGIQAWSFTEKSKLKKNSRELAIEPRAAHLWLETCTQFGVEPRDVRIIPSQKTDFEPYGDSADIFFGASLACCQLPVSSMKFVFGQGIGAMSNGHVPYMTLARFVDKLTRGMYGRATLIVDALLHWQKAAQITQDRAGLLASHDMSAAMFVIMKSSLDWSDEEIMVEIRRYHAQDDVDFGEKTVSSRIKALEIFEKSTLYAEACGLPLAGSWSMSEVDEAVEKKIIW